MSSEPVGLQYAAPKILRLKGVRPSDVLSPEDAAENMFLDSVRSDLVPIELPQLTVFEKIPERFAGLESWPTTTTLVCHECGQDFQNRPIFIPSHLCSSGEMGVLGNYCSWGCAARWIETQHFRNEDVRWRMRNNLRALYSIFNDGRYVSAIRSAPPRYELRLYGGPYTLEEWRTRARALSPSRSASAPTPAQTSALTRNGVWHLCGAHPPPAPTGPRISIVDVSGEFGQSAIERSAGEIPAGEIPAGEIPITQASKTESQASKTESQASKTESWASKTESLASKTESLASKTESRASKTETWASKIESRASKTDFRALEALASEALESLLMDD